MKLKLFALLLAIASFGSIAAEARVVTGGYGILARTNLPGAPKECSDLADDSYFWMYPNAEQIAVRSCDSPVKRVSDWQRNCEGVEQIYLRYGVSAQFECVSALSQE